MRTAAETGPMLRPTVVEVDVAAFTRNVDAVRAILPEGSRLIAVLEGDAYGHGAVPLARACARHHVAMIAVSLLEEAMELHNAAIDIPILVLGPLTGAEIEMAAEFELVMGVAGPEMVEEVVRISSRRRRPVRVHLKLDSGMGRIGLVESDLEAAAQQLVHAPYVQLDAIYSNFATASDPDHPRTEEQQERFRGMVEHLARLGVRAPLEHMANSAATVRRLVRPGDFARAGLLLVGGEPLRDGQTRLEPVMRWSTRVARLKTLPPDSSIGYGATYTTKRESRIATIPVGFGDGYPHSLSNRADVLIRGRRAPVVGRVSMHLATVDVTDIPDAAPGDEAVLLGAQGDVRITAEELAERGGTIPYEILSRAGARIPRVYVGAPE